jgi:hypothetical protein
MADIEGPAVVQSDAAGLKRFPPQVLACFFTTHRGFPPVDSLKGILWLADDEIKTAC